jgi:hypothetical protein
VTFKQVACPKAITDKSGCVRANDAINETPTKSTKGSEDVEISEAQGAVLARSGVDGVGLMGTF